MANLEKHGDEWAKKTVATLNKMVRWRGGGGLWLDRGISDYGINAN